jgi:branched-chain amino acid transport system permease protein
MLQAGIAGFADSGGAYAILAVCLILVFRTTGVLNFPIAAVGTTGTFLMSVLYGHGWSYGPAALVGVLGGALVSAAFGFAFTRWFFDSSTAHRATVAIALLLGTIAVSLRVFGDTPRVIPNMISGSALSVSNVQIASSSVLALIVALVVAAAITQTLGRSQTGLRLRAISQRPVSCELLGVPVRRLAVTTWATSGALATIALLLIAPQRSTEISDLSFLVVPALAAALVASFRRYVVAVIAAFALGAIQGMLSYSSTLSTYQVVIPFAMILVLLLWFERREVWDEAR